MQRGSHIIPRPIWCAIAHEHRSLRVADDVCAGRFDIGGRALCLDLTPDWRHNPLPEDEEWQIEWHKFYYGLDLAYAFERTGAVIYLDTWERLLLGFIRQVPVGADTSDVAARRVQNWIYAWQAFAHAPAFRNLSPDLSAVLPDALQQHVAYVQANLTPERNHRTLELYALFIVGLALPALDADGRLLPFALHELHRNLLCDILEDGVHRERSTHYHMIVLRSFLGVLENARRFALTLPCGFADRVEHAVEFAMHCHRPDGTIPPLSDSDTGSYTDLLELAGRLFDRADMRYVGTGGREGMPPRRTRVTFPVGGYSVQRSGWGEAPSTFAKERYLIFDHGPVGDGGHGHYDALSIEIAAHGHSLVGDPGRYTYAENTPNWRRWFKGTAAHNTACVDGLDQVPYRRGKPKGPMTECILECCEGVDGLEVLAASLRSPCYDAIHHRTILFIGGQYWLIHDRLRAPTRHRYDVRFHLTPGMRARVSPSLETGFTAHTSNATFVIWGDVDNCTVENGWIAPEYGVKHPARVLNLRAEERANADLLTAVIPCVTTQASPPRLTARAHGDNGLIATVKHSSPGEDRTDVIGWSNNSSRMTLGLLTITARAGWLQLIDGQPMAFRGCDVTDMDPERCPDFVAALDAYIPSALSTATPREGASI